MKILHTADLHLRQYGDERWLTLEELIRIGKNENIGVLLICGDLFDKGINAEDLRPKIRELFSNNDFKVCLIPGNHDAECFSQHLYFGENTIILENSPFEYKKVRFMGIPFEPIAGEALLARLSSLKKVMKDDLTNVLAYHGELLDSFFSRTDFGEEGESRYMPAKLSYFKDLNVDYVLAGHFHTKFDVRLIDKDRYFVYCGSPVSITRKEIGQRQINLFKIGEAPTPYQIDSYFFDERIVRLYPFKRENPLERVKEGLQHVNPNAQIILRVVGFINSRESDITEKDLAAEIKKLLKGKNVESHIEFRDIQRIVDSDLFRSFEKKLEQSDCTDEEIVHLRDMTIRAFMEAGR
jgi:DNA repair exonuclease SbcCD nuclease subunit